MRNKLAVVILNWNGRQFLEKFLPGLLYSCPDYAEVVVADNASEDQSVEFLQTHYPQIRLIRNSSNGGFSKGYNKALRQIEADYYCLLNSDIEVRECWIEPIIELLDIQKNIAIAQPKLRSFCEPKKFEYAGASGGFLDRYGYPFCRGRLFEVIEEDHAQYDEVMDVFWATGAAMFVRSELYHELGGLDEDFFAHMEEIDFCWRVKNRGYRVAVVPQSEVYHVGGGTLPKNNAFKTFLNFRNNLFLLVKNLPKNRLFITLFLRFFMDILAAFLFLFQGHGRDFTAVIKAQCAFWKDYRKMKTKRDNRYMTAFADTYPHSIVWGYYIAGKRYFNGKKLIK
ncbi:MAG: glycosyltransferase family 2 protein [Bacteroidales bacterium]|jgi:GT2 family glycosyltransferase|nr:glycosyltransferase family 2 protein [Bacteroidales bacterium]